MKWRVSRERYTVPFMQKEECARKLALLEDIRTAMGNLMAIHNEEVAALLRGDFDLIPDLRAKLQDARERKGTLRASAKAH